MTETPPSDKPAEGGAEEYGGDQDAEAPAGGEDALTTGERDQAEGDSDGVDG